MTTTRLGAKRAQNSELKSLPAGRDTAEPVAIAPADRIPVVAVGDGEERGVAEPGTTLDYIEVTFRTP